MLYDSVCCFVLDIFLTADFQVVNNATSVVTAMMAMVFLDMFGRRTLIMHGGWTQGAFLVSIAALGRIANPTVHEQNGIVAGMQLYTCILHMTLGPGAYITAAEVGSQALREKTMAFSVGSAPNQGSCQILIIFLRLH